MALSRLTVSTCMSLTEAVTMVGLHGRGHEVTRLQVQLLLGLGWSLFCGAWLLHLAFYRVTNGLRLKAKNIVSFV